LRRGDVVVLVLKGDYGKPRPGVVVQGDRYAELASVTVLPMTTTLTELDDIRILVQPTEANGLHEPTMIMSDKLQTVPRDKVGKVIGGLTAEQMTAVNRALALFLGFA
jgi:mRNA interferase MazF